MLGHSLLVYHSSEMPWTNRGRGSEWSAAPPGQAGQAGAGPRSRCHPREHPGTTSAHQQHPHLFPLVICTAQGAKCECTRLSSVHGPSSARPGGQGQPQTDPARQFCKPVHFQICESDGPPSLPRFSFLSSDRHLRILCTSAPGIVHARACKQQQQQQRWRPSLISASQLLICPAAFCCSLVPRLPGPPTRANSSSCQV